jgi:hypothetical protein
LHLSNYSGKVLYNSFGVSTNNEKSALIADNSDGYLMRNQFVNFGSGYGMMMNTETMPNCDENNYYSFAGTMGMVDGQNISEIYDLMPMTGTDENSSSVDPKFESEFDLHLTAYNENIFVDTPLTEMISQAEHNKYQKYSWDGYDRDAMGLYYFGIDNIKPNITIANHTDELLTCEGTEREILGVSAFADFGAEAEYQWEFDGKELPGENGAILYLHDLKYEMSGIYRCRVSAPGVSEPLYTAPIPVYVLSGIDIMKYPPELVQAPIGGSAKFDVKVHYRGIDYYDYEGPKLLHMFHPH